MVDVKRVVDDGSEKREVTLQIRDTGVHEILKSMGDGGHCSTGTGRLIRQEGELLFQFCFNVGRHETGIKALSVQVIIPLTDDEQKVEPPQVEENDVEAIADPGIGLTD